MNVRLISRSESMSDISKIDKNFKIETSIEREGLTFYDIEEKPFRIYGVWHDGVQYRRVPKDVAEATSPGVAGLATHTAGGRFRFVTDSPYVVIKYSVPSMHPMNHMALAGSSGFDLYERIENREYYRKSFIPTLASKEHEGVVDLWEEKKRVLTVNFPLYNPVSKVYVGIKEGSVLEAAPDYTVSLPMVSYGSSITQGGCASRPGNSYQAVISRRYDADYINLGFSGNGKGEAAIREYIASIKMSAFILDYDFNAPTNEHLLATHKPLYEAVRATNPDIPILMLARPTFARNAGIARRNEIIEDTYKYAQQNGDSNVYFIPSHKLVELCEDDGTVDGTHPTDLGFRSMANAISNILDGLFRRMM